MRSTKSPLPRKKMWEISRNFYAAIVICMNDWKFNMQFCWCLLSMDFRGLNKEGGLGWVNGQQYHFVTFVDRLLVPDERFCL